ncbi:hypothetical protein [Dickeya dadantii]
MRKLINYQPLPLTRGMMGFLPLLALLLVYLMASDARLAGERRPTSYCRG